MGYLQEYLAQCPEELLYLDYLEDVRNRNWDPEYQMHLEKCVKEAKLYKCRGKLYKDHLRTEYEGTVNRGAWLVDVYADSEGNYWTDDRVMIGKWIITGLELVSGQKDPDNTFQRHTGQGSDWDKVFETYGGIPSDWERITKEEKEAGHEDYSGNVA